MSNNRKNDPLEFGSLLSSRICHDLISPVSAISNGLELLEEIEDEAEKQSTLELVRQSARQTSAKLQLLRIAYGAFSSADSEVSLDMVKNVLNEYMEGERAELQWEVSSGSLVKDRVKLLLNAVLMAIRCIPRGGMIRVRMDATNGVNRLEVCSIGDKPGIPEDIREIIVGGEDEASGAKSIQTLYSRFLADSCGMELKVESSGESVCFIAEQAGEVESTE